jgi:hypothetical protein
MFPSYNSALAGPRAGASGAVFSLPFLRVHLEAAALFGTTHDVLGDISLGTATGGVTIALGAFGEGFALEIGPRLEMGAAWGSGQPIDPATRSASTIAFVSTGALVGRAALRLSQGVWGTVALDVGSVLYGLEARADDRRAAGVDGVTLGLAVGIAIDL